MVLSVAFVNLHVVELDFASGDVLRSRWGGLSLEWQAQEGFLIDVENEEVTLHVVVEGQLPSQFCILQLQREQTWLIEIFSNKIEQKSLDLERIQLV